MKHLTDDQIRANALKMWANYIESGDVNVCAKSLAAVNATPNKLTEEQKEFLLRLKRLAREEWEKVNHSPI